MAHIQLDIFSGRPNPVWELDAAQETELRRRLRDISSSVASVPVPGLGYRGFLVGGGEQLRVYHGQVISDPDAGTARVAKTGREIERWLLESGKAVLESSLYDWVRQQIGTD